MLDRLLNSIKNYSDLQKGFVVMAVGIAGVFFVLIVFFFLIKLLLKLFPAKSEDGEGA